MWTAATAAWPQITVDKDTFFLFVAGRLPEEGTSAEEAVARVRAADLYLACACGNGDGAAIRAFDTHYLADLDRVARRFRNAGSTAEDVRQFLHERFFLGTDGARPRIFDYGGIGDLRSWTRVTVVRTFLNLAARASREVPMNDDWLFALADGADANDVAYLKRTYGEEVKIAFKEAVLHLSFRDRTVLRYAFVDELSSDRIGEIYGIHRATAARWVGHAKDRFGKHLRTELKTRLRVSAAELESIMRLSLSGIELSLARHLAGPPLSHTA